MTSDVSELVEDNDEVGSGIAETKGLRAMHLASLKRRAERQEAERLQTAMRRSEAQRDVKITLPKLSYLEDGE